VFGVEKVIAVAKISALTRHPMRLIRLLMLYSIAETLALEENDFFYGSRDEYC
jgi:hypothetical protein